MSDTAPFPDLTSILVVRHGQSVWNADGRWQGQADPPLSTLGVRQARAAAASLGTFDAVVASHLERAATTATLIAEELGIGPVTTDPDLQERFAGEWQGMTRPEIEDQYPGYLAAGRRPPSWEPDDALLERSARGLGRIAAGLGAGATALVVSHGGVILNLEAALDAPRKGRCPNLGGRWFGIGDGQLVAGDVVLLVDPDTATVPTQI